MAEIRVLMHGALGKMGQAVSAGLQREPDIVVVAAVDVAAEGDRYAVPGVDVPLASSVEGIPADVSASVLVDFSHAEATPGAVEAAASRGMNFVVGTTGLSDDGVAGLERIAERHGVGGVVAPNFAIGAVLMMHLAQRAAPHFDHAEIIEMHHETKIDAPSGTAATTARMLRDARGADFERNVPERETVADTRAGESGGVTIHSLRLPGAMAHQEVIFGIAGQTLSIRHDTINRDCYVPGIARAVRRAAEGKGFVFGLDRLLGL